MDLNESEIDLNESEIDLNKPEIDLNESEIKNVFKNKALSPPIPPFVPNTRGVKVPCSTSVIIIISNYNNP